MVPTVVHWGSTTSHYKLHLSIRHSKPKAGSRLAEVKLLELLTVTGAGLSSVQFCTSVHVCVSGQRQAQEITPPLTHSVVCLHPYISPNRRRKAVSELPVIPATASPFFIQLLILFLVSLLQLPPSLPDYQTADRSMAPGQALAGSCHRLTDYVTTH